MKLYKMKYYLSIICIYISLTICSMEKMKSDTKVTVKGNGPGPTQDTEATNTKGTANTKENVYTNEHAKTKQTSETKENAKATETVNKQTYYQRKSYATKDDIPVDYLEYLKKRHNIIEDPAGKYDRLQAEYGDYDYEPYDNDEYVNKSDNKDNKDGKESTEESVPKDEEKLKSDENSNESEETCKACEIREQDRQLRLATIQSTILGKLGFSSSNLPNMTGKTIPQTPSILKVIEQHEMQSDAPYTDYDDYLPEDNFYGQVKKAYTIAQKPPDDFKIHVEGGCYFDLPESVTSRKVNDASLWIYLEPSALKRKDIVEIYLYVIPQKAKPKHILKGPVRYKKTSSFGWIEFKFAHIVHHWIKNPEANKGIVIHAFDKEGINHVITPGEGSDEKFIPLLEMSTAEHRDGHHRKKRSFNNICTEHERIDTCCRYPLRVDFVQFGWDWVIAPTGYVANYCSGECRYRHMENNPQAYLIQQTPDVSGPCCTPSKFFPLAMLYFDHAHTVLYTYMQKMIVVRCGCA